MKNKNLGVSKETLFRYQVVSQVLSQTARGEVYSVAVNNAASMEHHTPEGKSRSVSKRSIYRWLKAWEKHGFEGLLPAERLQTQSSVVLNEALLDFFCEQKGEDPKVSIPELIRRAQLCGMIRPEESINRITVWRALNRRGIITSHRKSAKKRDARRFAYPHRMDMVICDGKQFRAGPGRLRRVALYFEDDCTRMGLNVVVGTSETSALFLRGLYETIKTYGLMSAMYVDNGSGFIANDDIDVLMKLNILFIHGTAGYPQGRGKIERFNRTAADHVLRFLDGNPEINPDCSALELRLRHHLREQYNLTAHEGINKVNPWFRFKDDSRALRYAKSDHILRQSFILQSSRRVSADNIVSFKSTAYELMPGYAGTRITLHRNVLDDSIAILHDGRMVVLFPVDIHANARDKRAKIEDIKPTGILPKSSAQINFENNFSPIIDAQGGFSGKSKNRKEVK